MTRTVPICIALGLALAVGSTIAAPKSGQKPASIKPVNHVMPPTKNAPADGKAVEDNTEREIWRHHGMS